LPGTGTDADNWFRSIETRLRNDSPAGAKIADKYTAFRVDKGVIAGNWESKMNAALKGLSDKDVETVVDALENRTQLRGRLEDARQRMIKLDTEITEAAKAKDLKMRDAKGEKLIPFKPMEGYWPRIYSPSFWKNPQNVANALVKKYGISEAKAAAIVSNASKYGGRLIDEGERIGAGFAKKFGTKLKSPQHVRQLDLPGYLKTREAYRIHIRDMADRIAAKDYFGDLDIAGGEFADLIKQTSNPNEMKKLLERVFEREMSVPTEKAREFANAALTAGTTAHLSNFLINNPLQLAMSAAKAPRAIPAGIKAAFQRGKRLKAATESGALLPIHSDAIVGTEGLQNKLAHFTNKGFGIEASEKFTRSVSSAMGQDEATRLFGQLKRNPNSDRIRNQIEQLTMTPANELLAQEALTKKQLDRAGGMFSSKTQGRAQSFDLPYHLTGGSAGPYKNLGLQFTKYAIVQPRLLMEAVANKPITTPLTAAAAYLGGSEAIGAIKDAKRATVASMSPDVDWADAWKEAREKRGEPGLGRTAKTLAESWIFGYPAQFLGDVSKGGIRRGVEGMLPPIVTDTVAIGEAAAKVYAAETEAEQVKRAANFLAKYAPYIGYDVANSLLAVEAQKSKKSGGRGLRKINRR
jgi:ribosomal protein S13